ncbi:MAG: alpha/beta fold hydrolase, partial [Lachnospiraceae bacterium]|nr:alpha/beta fold hydrolase [Lachnospiraceae bacterium]
MGERCRTKYPIVLIHGAGFRDLKWPVYWGRIPSRLESEGAVIRYGLQDCWAGIETNAEVIAARIREITEETGCEKVHVIAHSKGGLDARMAASSFGCGDRIASLTTVATPHHGSKTLDRMFALPRPVWDTAALAINNWIRLVGDQKPDFLQLCRDMTTEQMRRFNRENPDVPGVLYQSFACVMKHP